MTSTITDVRAKLYTWKGDVQKILVGWINLHNHLVFFLKFIMGYFF